jgi:hypothetical protein
MELAMRRAASPSLSIKHMGGLLRREVVDQIDFAGVMCAESNKSLLPARIR